MRGTRIPRVLVVRNYLNNQFVNYTCLTHSRIRVELASPANLGLRINQQLFGHTNMSVVLPYTRGTRIPRLLKVRNYINNYLALSKHLTRSIIGVELASAAYLRLRII